MKAVCLISSLVLMLIGLYIGKISCKQTGLRDQSFARIIAERHSGYRFDQTKSITIDQLQQLMNAARSAPSSYNDQPWSFIICDRATNLAAFEQVVAGLDEFNQKWAAKASLLVLCIAYNNSHKGQFNHWAQYDTGAASFGMMLQATALGLMAHQMGGFDAIKLKNNFKLPESCVVMSVMAIGYPDTEEQYKRSRKPLSDNFFVGEWGHGIS